MQALSDYCCKQYLIAYEPQIWSKRLGQKCQNCAKSLTHEKCISLCKCYYFCHQMCFIQKFEPQITNQSTNIICTKCQWKIHAQFQTDYVFDPSYIAQNIAQVILSFVFLVMNIIGIVLTVNTPMPLNITFIVLYGEGLLISLALYLVYLAFRAMLYRKVIKIKEVTSTKMEIQTSAFKDLELGTNEEITKEQLIFNTNQR